LFKKINDTFRTIPGIPDKKLALIFVSCRVYPELDDVTEHIAKHMERKMGPIEDIKHNIKNDLALKYYYIRENGMDNTTKYRPVTNMVLRRKAGDKIIRDEDEGPFDVSSPDISKFEEDIQSIIHKTSPVILKRYNLWSKGQVVRGGRRKKSGAKGGSRKHKQHTKKRKHTRKKHKHKQMRKHKHKQTKKTRK